MLVIEAQPELNQSDDSAVTKKSNRQCSKTHKESKGMLYDKDYDEDI